MTSEQTFWTVLWTLLASVLITLIISLVVSTQLTNTKILEAVRAGADPIAAACAIGGPNGSSGEVAICAVAAQREVQ